MKLTCGIQGSHRRSTIVSGLRVALRGDQLRISRTEVVGGPHMSGGQQQCGEVQQQTPEQTLDHVCGGPVGSSSQSGIRGLLDPGCTYEGPHGATRQTRRPIQRRDVTLRAAVQTLCGARPGGDGIWTVFLGYHDDEILHMSVRNSLNTRITFPTWNISPR